MKAHESLAKLPLTKNYVENYFKMHETTSEPPEVDIILLMKNGFVILINTS